MKKLFALVLSLVLVLSLAASAETIVIGATASPHAEILEFIKPDLAELGYELDIKIFDDYNLPCPATASGELMANYFAHVPFIDSYNANAAEDAQVIPVIGVHYEPFGIYSNVYASIDEVQPGAKVVVPNDVSNQTRALFLLQDAGLITLPEGSQPTDALSILDIAEYNVDITITDIDASQTPSTLSDADLVVINGNYALSAGLSPLNDAIFYEPADGQAATIFANYVAVAEKDVDAEWVEALRTALCSEKVYEFITDNEEYAGGVVPFFSLEAAEEE